MMRAVIYETYGGPERLRLVDLPRPEPKPGELLVRIHATTVTSGDVRMRAFDIPPLFRLPARFMLGWPAPKQQILGFDYAGVVEAVGAGVTAFRPGDAVFGGHVGGAHAEYRCVPADSAIALKPAGLAFAEVAALPFGGHTALHFLRAAGLEPGQSILILGASGAVGTAAVQIATHRGATVTGLCSAANAELVRSLGATDIIDYTRENIRARGRLYDVIFDTVGALRFADALPLLTPGGTFIEAVMSPGDLPARLGPPARKGRRYIAGEAADTAESMREIAALAASGALRPVIDSTYVLADIRAAHARVDTKRKRGAVVVTVV